MKTLLTLLSILLLTLFAMSNGIKFGWALLAAMALVWSIWFMLTERP